MKYTVKKLATAADISVRALHHYDEIGLLKPAGLEGNGYRYYGEAELLRLQQIMFFRELEFPLEKIKEVLDDPKFNNLEALETHKQVLLKQKSRLAKLIKTIDQTINNLRKGVSMNASDMYGGFTKQQMEEYETEARARWGNSDAYKQSAERVKKMGPADLKKVIEEGKYIELELSQVMDKLVTDPVVQALIVRHRAQISHFYDVSDAIYRGLAEMYVSDPRFTKHYEDIKPGLAQFLRDAILASLK